MKGALQLRTGSLGVSPRPFKALARSHKCYPKLSTPVARLPGTTAHYGYNRSSRNARIQKGSVSCRFLRGTHGPLANRTICIAASKRGNKLIVAASILESSDTSSVHNLLNAELETHPHLEIDQLPNGLRYVILPNATPPARFEAHLEVHAGSVDEGEAEQGIAHLVEHVTFLGSKKRESLLGTGARSNAYTDFHHTVFHVHSPHLNANTGEPMLPAVLDALTEIAFEPEFLPSRIEKERKAVVAEAQMMNTIEYRVDCQLLQYLHWENALGCRFPIGKTEQVQQWQRQEIMDFWKRHYFPSNAVLYVVGDVDIHATKELIASTFGRIPLSLNSPTAMGGAVLDAEILNNNDESIAAIDTHTPITDNGSSSSSHTTSNYNNDNDSNNTNNNNSTTSGALLDAMHNNTVHHKGKGLFNPPVEHQWGCGSLLHAGRPAPVSIFRHRLLQLFQLSIFCKLPIRPMTTMEDLRRAFMVRILLSVMQFRINARYVAADPPFIGIELDHSDSGREGCAVSTLTITSEPKDWRGAVQVAVQEVRRLQRYGVTAAELERYKSALLRDSEQLAEGADSVPSLDNLEFVMESLALGHTVLEQRQAHAYLLALADSITTEEVNALSRSLLSYVSHYGNEAALQREWEAAPDQWAEPGPTIATAIVACVPAFMDASGHSTGAAAPMARGASMATTQHVDPAAAAAAAMDESGDDEEPPEGAVKFELDAAVIEEALSEDGLEVEALADVDVPDALLSDEQVTELVQQRQPRFIESDNDDCGTGVVRRKLSNGIRVNYRKTDNEPRGAMVRVVAAGGRALEPPSTVSDRGQGVVAVGTRTLSESGTVGAWSREQVELFCISRLINCVLEATEEFICMDFHFAVGDGGVAAVLQLLHLFLEQPRWEDAAMERSKQMYLSHYRSLPKSLERATADRIMSAMMGDDRRFRDPSTEEISALSLEGMRYAVMKQLHAGNLEVSVVGDIDLDELEDAVLKYLGTVAPRSDGWMPGTADAATEVARICSPPAEDRHMVWHLRDSDERACAYIAGTAPNRWGNFTEEQQSERAAGKEVVPPPVLSPNATAEEIAAATAARRAHPLYASVTLNLLSEIINSRLFTTVRDTLGLTYDVSFELSLFDRLPAGWFNVNVTSTPQKIKEAMMASLRVLRSGASQPFTQRDLLRAKRTLLTRHESDLKDNAYWLALLTHIQSESVPLKTVQCLRDLKIMYESITVEDIYDAYNQFDFSDDAVFTCIGTSGKETVVTTSPLLDGSMGNGVGSGRGVGGGNGVPPEMDPEAFISALKAFMGNMQQQQQSDGGKQ